MTNTLRGAAATDTTITIDWTTGTETLTLASADDVSTDAFVRRLGELGFTADWLNAYDLGDERELCRDVAALLSEAAALIPTLS